MKRILFTLSSIFICTTAFSQNVFSIKGKLIDKNNKPISIGNVLLLQNDSIVKYTYVIDGIFSLEAIPKNYYVLKISSLGYESYQEKIELHNNIETIITLKETLTELDEVKVIATKKLIENRNGNIVVNIENTILSKETNAIDLLSKLPSIQVSPNRDVISVLGKGNPLIYVGGQRISIDDFKSLQIDEIKTIEIINNPSVKYEAEGRSVILITRRKSSGKGTKVSLTETASFKTYFNNYFSINLNTKKNNLEFKLDAAYNQIKVWESNSLDYQLIDKNTNSNYLVEAVTTRPQFIFGGGLYYQLNNTDYLSFNSRVRTQKEPFYIDTQTSLNDNGIESNIDSYSDNIGERFFFSSNMNYFNTLTEKSNLFLGIQYSTFKQNIQNDIKNTYDNPPLETFLNRVQGFRVGNFSARIDYDISFKKDVKLELGANFTNSISKAFNEIEKIATNYTYSENNIGLYSQLSGTFKKVNYSFGARVENTKVTAGFRENNLLEIERESTFLFPKGSINFSIDSTKTITLTFAKSIKRPKYSTASSTSAFINPILEFRGNINLKPTLTDEVSATFQFNNNSFTARYSYTKDPVHYSLIYDENDAISVMFPSNFKEEYGVAFDLSIPLKYKFWKSNNIISLNFNTINDERAVSLNTSPYFYFYTNHQFNINNTTAVNLNGWGFTNRQEGIFDREKVYVLNASISKKFFNKLDATLSFNDIFNSMEFTDRYKLQNIKAMSLFYTDVNEISLSLKYTFGNIKSAYKNKNVDTNLNRIQ